MAGKYPQPPGDAGSRKNLADRKGKVDRVEKAYVGIVNVYSLIPKGGGAVKIEEFNIPPAPPGTKIYPQSRPPKMSNAEKKKIEKEAQRLIDLKTNAGIETFDLVYSPHSDVYKFQKYVGGKGAGWITDMGVYEQWLKDHPKKENQRGYNLESKKVKLAIREMRKVHNTKDFERITNRQAMNLSVSRGRLLQWYNASSMNMDKVINTANKHERDLQADKKAKEALAEANQKSKAKLLDTIDIDNIRPVPKIITVPSLSELPIPPGKQIQKISFSESMDKSKYLPLAPGQIRDAYQADPDHVVITQDGNNISYFADIRHLSVPRKRKLIKANMKRPRFIFKISKRANKIIKANVVKKKILGKLRCKCRRKR